jgi:hypothetical protein
VDGPISGLSRRCRAWSRRSRTILNRSTHAAGACTLPFRAGRDRPRLAGARQLTDRITLSDREVLENARRAADLGASGRWVLRQRCRPIRAIWRGCRAAVPCRWRLSSRAAVRECDQRSPPSCRCERVRLVIVPACDGRGAILQGLGDRISTHDLPGGPGPQATRELRGSSDQRWQSGLIRRRTSARLAGRDDQGCGQPGDTRCGVHHRAEGTFTSLLPGSDVRSGQTTVGSISCIGHSEDAGPRRSRPWRHGQSWPDRIRVCQRCTSQEPHAA